MSLNMVGLVLICTSGALTGLMVPECLLHWGGLARLGVLMLGAIGGILVGAHP